MCFAYNLQRFQACFVHLFFVKKGLSTTSQFVAGPKFLSLKPLYRMDPRICFPGKPVKARPYPSFFKKSFIFHKLFKSKEGVFADLGNTVSHAFYFYVYSRSTQNENRSLKVKWKTGLIKMKFH